MPTIQQLPNTQLEVHNYNNDFLLLKSLNDTSLRFIGQAIFERQFDFAAEVIVTQVEICIKLNPCFHPKHIDLLDRLDISITKQGKSYKLPVYFKTHEDWDFLEKRTGLNQSEIIQQLCAIEFSVAMFGFLPGFIYFDGLPPRLQVPRKAVPSKYIPANSLALGGKYLGVYSIASPGGWYVLGQLAIPLLHLAELPPVALNLSDTLRLKPIEQVEYESLQANPITLKSYNL